MSLTLRTNRWASRIIIILHLVIWNAVGIVLLQKGVSILWKRMLETNHIIETNSSIESTMTSVKLTENDDLAVALVQQQLIDQNEKIMIRNIISESSLRNDKNYSGLNVIRNELLLSNSFENMIAKQKLENHLTEENHRIDHLENKSASSKISRMIRDKEHILDDRISKNIPAKENDTRSESKEEENFRDVEKKNLNPVEIARESKFFSIHENIDHQATNNSLRKSSSKMKFSPSSGAAMAVAMVAIGTIMLLVGPVVIILRVLDEREQTRKLHALSIARQEDPPPTYEQVVFSSEAPRYSTLALNDDNSLPPSPPPSPTFVFPNLSSINPHST